MLTNPVVLSVLVMAALCLLKLNVLVALLVAALVGGLLAGIPLGEIMGTLIGGMGGNSETALSYILLGTLAMAVSKSGAAAVLARTITKGVQGKAVVLTLVLAFVASLSQNLIPVHIAFIPILIPPLLGAMNKLNIDRRAIACALTFGLKAPYVVLPVGYGLIFHGIIRDQMAANGLEVPLSYMPQALLYPGLGMLLGLFVAVFFSYRKGREYASIELAAAAEENVESGGWETKHFFALLGAVAALVVQIQWGSLPLGALVGLAIMLGTGVIKWKEINELLDGGIGMMGFIAFVMLVAAGYGAVIRETGGVEALVDAAAGAMAGSQFIGAFVMLLVGLVVTMGIGTSFGTIPIIAAIYVPLGQALGFSPIAIVALIGTAAALGDAGSPASDSTLGPTAGLNADGQHDHIWDTCVPTFLHFNVPLIIFGVLAALIL